jgi:hypothetical protein
MKTPWLLWAAPFFLGAGALAFSQDPEKPPDRAPKPDDKFRPEAPRPEEEADLTPEQAMAMLREVRTLMEKSEELLQNSSRGKALETEEELLRKIKDLLKDEEKSDPGAAQKQILEKIERLMKRSEGHQKNAIERMADLIRRAKS